jgi:rfaE bifunctional protein kinase chain/domain/rfaE bifunctional protein nucleotidyltransferase chain/domain
MKIKTLDELAQIVREGKRNGQKVVHCHGVFDLLHIGHIRHFEQARRMGNILVVTITPDRYVDKGPHRPAFPETLRAEAIASLGVVDYVAVNEWPTAEETLKKIRPDVFVKGAEFKNTASDMTGKIGREEEVAKEIGVRLSFTEDIVFSSTNLINRYLSNLPEEIDQYLSLFRARYELNSLLTKINAMTDLKVLVVGDTILDEYQYCEPLGKSTKDPVLTVLYQSKDLFAGGVLAVANHLASFSDHVDLVTILGGRESHEAFIRQQLDRHVTPHFFLREGAPTLIKRRFVDGYSFNKLFEVYIMDDSELGEKQDAEISRFLEDCLPNYDLVLVADYGHGTISERMVRTICSRAKFLALNVQCNSGNRGFHTVTRYPRADYICIAEHEVRLEMRKRNGAIRPMMESLGEKLKTRQFVVTRGRKGCLVSDNNSSFVAVPAFAETVVDRVGAGDAFLSVSALASVLGFSNEELGFVGNVVGSLAVSILGNKKPIDKLSVSKFITSLMK